MLNNFTWTIYSNICKKSRLYRTVAN